MKHLNHPDFLYKPKLEYIKKHIKNIQKINILEFGVMNGRSTKMFLDLCDDLDGTLNSVDINGKITGSNWQVSISFFKSVLR